MSYKFESMLRATDAASRLALLREFNQEADNLLAHLESIADACQQEVKKQPA